MEKIFTKKENKKDQFYKKALFFSVLFLFFLFSIPDASASDRLSISVTPPLFRVSVEPGQPWASSVKLVNSGSSEIEIFANPVNFEATGESGMARFTPRLDKDEDALNPAGWISVSRGPYSVPAEGSVDIPFTVFVPEDAPPGGHYAAFLVGTDPSGDMEGSGARVSSLVTSLLLMKVEGDVVEEGDIREFRTDAGWFDAPDVRFTLRFKNSGNVHLRPRGVIEIEDMWGNDRGSIPVNSGSSFGNVLPDSTRTFRYRWEGEGSIMEAGRYTADLVLSYGSDGHKTVTDRVTFWVIPIVPLVVSISILFLFIFILFISIRLYIRRVLAYEGVSDSGKQRKGKGKTPITPKAVLAPARESVIDMKRTVKDRGERTYRAVFFDILKRYRYLFASLFMIIIVAILVYIFISSGIYSDRSFRIFQEHPIGEEEVLP